MVSFVCPDGHNLEGTLERLTGVAQGQPVYKAGTEFLNPKRRTIIPEHTGYTEVDWDSERTVRRNGRDVWVCDNGDEFTSDQLLTSDAWHAANPLSLAASHRGGQ